MLATNGLMSNLIHIPISPQFSMYLCAPVGLLSEYVSLIWASEGVPPFGQERVVPDGASVLLFNLGKSVESGSGNETVSFKKTLLRAYFRNLANSTTSNPSPNTPK